MSRATGGRLAPDPPQDDDGVPAEDLAQPGHADDPLRPRRVVAREDGEHFGAALGLDPARPAHHRPDRAGEEGAAEVVLRSAAMLPLVPVGSAVAAEVVPRRGLVPAPRREPRSPREEDHTAGTGDAQHVLGHPDRLRHVLQHVAGERDVERPVGEREGEPGAPDGVARGTTSGRQLAGVRLESRVVGTRRGEGVGEVARPAAHVEDARTVEVGPSPHHRHRVRRERSVETVGVGLLDAEGAEERHRAGQRRTSVHRTGAREGVG